ncbi:hypothetical protein QZH41_008320, partial [Actinostola sp. cb2023]
NDTIDKCNAGDASLTTRIQTQETKENNDVTTLQKAINDTIDKCTNVNNTLTAKIDAVSKMQGPIGLRGYNGSQGTQGPQGPSGAGNLTQCVVTIKPSANAALGASSTAVVQVLELAGKKILHSSCSSNIADTVEHQERLVGGKKEYSCFCSGQGNYATFSGSSMICYITYTECPLIS